MPDVISSTFDLMVPHGQLEECISTLEDGLGSLKPTPYHEVLGKNFLHHKDELAVWIEQFFKKSEDASIGLKALYLEMNGFAINSDQWFCNMFGFKHAGDVWDLDWLADWDAEHPGCFVLRGMESVQMAFGNLRDTENPLGIKIASEVTEHLVTARFMQLVAAAHTVANRRCHALMGLPILASAHDWDTVHQTT